MFKIKSEKEGDRKTAMHHFWKLRLIFIIFSYYFSLYCNQFEGKDPTLFTQYNPLQPTQLQFIA